MSSTSIKLVVALGNPGRKYENTKHNIGWAVVESLSFASRLTWVNKFKGLFASHTLQGDKVLFLKPQTFMNLSGESVQALIAFFQIQPNEILVVHDELDLPFGRIQLKRGGGLAGHNGLKSIAQLIGTNDFLRLRVGIDRPQGPMDVASWVLAPFSGDAAIFYSDYIQETAKVLELALTHPQGVEKVASLYGKKFLIPQMEKRE